MASHLVSLPTGRRSARRGTRPEDALAMIVAALVCFGIVMVYSASSSVAALSDQNPMGYATKQAIFALVGLGAYALATRMNLRAVHRWAGGAVALSGVALVAVLVPGLGVEVNGSRRWLPMPLIGQVQPAEIAKVALICWVATAVARNPRMVATPRGLVPYLGVTALFSLLILVEPDLGTASMLFLVTLAILAVAGARFAHLAMVSTALVFLAGAMIALAPYRRARLFAFLDPWSDPEGKGFQVIQAQVAVGTGGLHGVGLGDGLQKAWYLPEAHTDMILATIGEEIGFIGIMAVLAAIAAVVLLGFRIAMRAPDVTRRLIAVGLTVLIAAQCLDNAASTLGMMPITGVPLPFVSYGGSSLIVLLFSTGILVNIGRGAKATATKTKRDGDRPPAARDDRGQRDGRTRGAGGGGGRGAARAWG